MAKRSELPLMEPLSDGEFEELDDLLLSDNLPEECMDAVTLEGFLTAIAIGPVTVTPEQRLPHVFGSDPEDPMPEFPSVKIFERVVNLIMRFYNSVIMIFEIAPRNLAQPSISARWKARPTPSSTSGVVVSYKELP